VSKFNALIVALMWPMLIMLASCAFAQPADTLAAPNQRPASDGPPGNLTATTEPTPATAPEFQPSQIVQPPATYTAAAPIAPGPVNTQAPPVDDNLVSPTQAPSPEPYAGLFVDDLVRREYGGGLLEIIDTLEVNDSFTRYLITYPSDGLTIYGFMNVPNEGSHFPVVIALHGYIDPGQYRTLDYTTRYADHLAEAGYFVIHPNMRGFPPSDEGNSAYRVGLAVDVLNLIAIIREQSQDPTGYLRRADTDDINLWGHSMGGGVALRAITVDNSPYIRSVVLYGAMSGDERQNYEKIKVWSNGEVGDFELAASPALLKAISPINHLDRVNTAVSIHHGQADDVVPPEWSDDLCRRLQGRQIEVECYVYEGMPHTFRGANDTLFMDRTVAFFDKH
jgi:dienelactone hydrolase